MNEQSKSLQAELENILWSIVDESMRILPEKETAQERITLMRDVAGILTVCGVKVPPVKL